MATQSFPVGGPEVPDPNANEPGSVIPFRRATTYRAQEIGQTGPIATIATQQNVEMTVEGSGYIYGIDIDVQGVTAGNAAAVTFAEDGPYSAIPSVIFRDVQGELVNLDGYSLYLLNLYGAYLPWLLNTSQDTRIYQAVTGGGATGGSFRFHLWVPVGTNLRDLIGLLGNQDRAMRYQLRTDIAPTAQIYGVAPTNAPQVTIQRTYHSFAVPGTTNANGARQEQVPPKFGVLHYSTKNRNASAPQGGSTVNHYLARLGNTIRLLILVFRSNGTRANAEANMPSRISFKLGDVPIFTETVAHRRMLMFKRYGWDAPAGVLVYDAISDFYTQAGAELGEDYWWTNGLVNAQFEITYPAGFGAANNSLDVITDDLAIPQGMDFYG